MGVMRFVVHPVSAFDELPPQTQMTGFDGRTFPLKVEMEGDTLLCTRQQSDSGRLHALCDVAGEKLVLSTASLRERTEPYVLSLELARGTICDLRNQVGAWDVAGLRVPAEFNAPFARAHKLFRAAVLSQSSMSHSSNSAWEAIEHAIEAGRILTEAYVAQRLVFRQSRSQSLPVSLGCDSGIERLSSTDLEKFASVFNSVVVPISWSAVEPVEGAYAWDALDETVDWCHQNRMFVVAGPLLDLGPDGMPAWLQTWQHDFLNLQSFVSDFVETAVSRYVGRVRHWEIIGNANTGGALALSEENRLSLAARTLEIARQVDDEIQLSMMIGQPFGEYMTAGQHRLSPIQFVDALARSGIGLSEVHLDIRLGEHGDCSLPRHLLQFSRLIDQWSYLGLPLSVTISCVGQYREDQKQLAILKRFVPVLMAKDCIVGIYWGCLRDGQGSRRDGCGLLRDDGSARETFNTLRNYRSRYWKSD